jgi:3-deoxy-D-manno-octulosonic-acid transferase
MFFIYSFLYCLVLFMLLPYEYLKRPKDLRSRWLRERFGFFDSELLTPDSKLIWVHAVSVGEVTAAVPFIKEIKARHPSLRIVLSTVTDTGRKVARERAAGIADVVYLPFDLAGIFRRVFRKARPALFVTIETELWPNIFRTCKREGVPVLVFNGRLSDNSFRGYKRIRFFIRDVVRCVDLFCMQDRLYGERIKELGADWEKVKVIGNFKFDTMPSDKLPEWAGFMKGTVIIAGSTHEGEEELILSVFGSLKNDFPDLNLILAPRHPERFGKVEEMVKASGLPYLRRSGLVHGASLMAHDKKRSPLGHEPSAVNRQLSGTIIILDTIGELPSAYGVSDISVIGGSFIDRGGHNPLEPAFWGKPVVCGPHMENFPFMQDFYIGSGAMKTDAEGLYEVLRELIRSPEKRKIMGERARALYREKAGAVNRAVEVLESYLEPQLPFSEQKPLP